MDLDTLAKVSDFVGGIVLVISLVYLAYQVRQNTQSLRSENYARVLERMSTVQAQLSMDADLHHVFMVGAEDPARLSRWRDFVAGDGLPAPRTPGAATSA